jgi:hypothetical protein
VRHHLPSRAVDQNGGALAIDTPPAKPGLRPYLMHSGASLSAIAAAYVAGVPFQANLSDRVKVEIPSMEPGAYSLCMVADPPAPAREVPACASGVLAPHGTLSLSRLNRWPLPGSEAGIRQKSSRRA